MSEMPTLQTTSPSDPALLSRFTKSGDEKAFSALMQRHWGFVFAITRRSLTNTALAEDATQQTFIALSKKAKTLCKNRPLGPWLYRTAIQEASNLRRREMRHQKRNRDYQAISQPESDPETQLSAKLHRALSSLSTKDRQLIILRYYEGLTADQIATELKISPAAAQRRTHRALERLSSLAKTQEEDQESFSQALPALLAPSINPPSTSLSKILATSAKSTGLLIPAAGWILATTLSVAAVKQVTPPPPAEPKNTTETLATARTTSQRKARTVAKPPEPPRDPDVAHFIALARNSPNEAFAWSLKKYPSPNKLQRFLRSATRYLAQSDLAFAEEILAVAKGESVRVAIISEIFKEKFRSHPVSAIQWIESLPYQSDHTAISRVHFSSSFQPPNLIETLEENLTIATKRKVHLWIVESLCELYEEIDEPKILDLANSLEGEAQRDALISLARIQLDRDHPQAAELINRLKGDLSVQETRVVQRAPARYLDAVLPWIPNPTDHQSPSINASRFLETWLDYDPKAARQWFQKNKPGKKLFLTAETRKSLTQSDR